MGCAEVAKEPVKKGEMRRHAVSTSRKDDLPAVNTCRSSSKNVCKGACGASEPGADASLGSSARRKEGFKPTLRQRRKMQRDFLDMLGPMGHLLKTVLDICPDVFAWFADKDDRLMFVSRMNVEMCNLGSELDVIGKTCGELFPQHMAEIYMEKCRQVRRTGRPLVETVYDHASDFSTELRIGNILPLRTPSGKIVGTVSIYRRANSNESTPDWYGKVKRAVAYIDAHYAEGVSVETVARESGLSESQFRRVFEQVIAKSPVDYITTIRLNAARKLLATTEKSVADIAVEVGFFDQSHFIKAFKRERGTTPGRYRREIWKK